MDSIKQWLMDLGLSKYNQLFVENDIDLSVLPHITEEDLKEMGVTIGARRKILTKIQAQREAITDSPPNRTRSSSAERRQLTVLFCDMVGSTKLSGQLDPEDLRDIMRLYQDAVAGSITRYGGHIAKYLGDGVLAYFGWPQAYEDQAERAVRAGLDAVAAVRKVYTNETERLKARIGIETGQVVVGDLIGEIGHDSEAVSGETPNLAARLQSAAEPETVFIGPVTRRLIRQAFILEDMGTQQLKGFVEPVQTWSVIGRVEAASRFEKYQGTSTTSLVGREHEIGLLRDRWHQSKTDGGQAVCLSGEAGIGKSRLVQALQDHVSDEPCFRLRYQCSPHHVNSAFHPVIQQLKRTARFSNEDTDDEKLDKLESLLRMSETNIDAVAPFFAILLGLQGKKRYQVRELNSRQFRERTFAALLSQVIDLAKQRPVLLILEDTHWIDPTTQSLFGQLLDVMADVPVFVLLTQRPNYVSPWENHSNLTSVTLNRLNQDQAAKIVLSIAGHGLPTQVIDRIVARADGIPLYLEELTKSVLEADENSDLVDTGSTIPERLQALLAARLDRLAKAKEIAQIGAVIGREFPYQLLTMLTDMESHEIDANLDKLVESGLIYRRGTSSEASYIFKHALIQDAAYDGLLISRRRELHTKIVRTVERVDGTSLDEKVEMLAYHSQRGELWDKSIEYCRLAGLKANERSAYSEALNFLEAGLNAGKKVPENECNLRVLIDIRLSMRPSLGAFGQYNRFLEMLSEAETIAQKLGDNYTTALVSVEKTHVLYQTGHVVKAVELGHKAAAMAATAGDQRLIVGAAANLAMALFFHGELREARDTAIKHSDVLKTTFRHDQLGTTGTSSVNWLSNLAGMNTLLGDLHAAKSFCKEAVLIAEESNKPFDLAMAEHWKGFIQISTGELSAALQTLEQVMKIIEENELDFMHLWAAIHLGTACALTGQHERSDVLLTGAALRAEQLGLVLPYTWALALLAQAKIQAGFPEDALDHASNALKFTRKHGFQWLEILALLQLARGTALLGKKRFEDAEDFYKQAASLADRLETRLLLANAERGLGETYFLAERHIEAKRHLRLAKETYRSMELPLFVLETDRLLDKFC